MATMPENLFVFVAKVLLETKPKSIFVAWVC